MSHWWQAEPNEVDLMSAYRERIIRALTVAGSVVFLPFAVNNFIQGRITVGIGTCVMLLILAVDAYASFKKRPLPIAIHWIIVPIVPTIMYAVHVQGFGPALWSFPAIILFYFVLARWEANIFSIMLAVVLTPMAYGVIGREITLRFFATLTVTAVFGNVLIGIISGLQQKLLDQSIHDPLTDAYNRRHMESTLALALERSRRSESPASLCLFDVDHFKRVNDAYGHAAGDAVLKQLVVLVKQRMRKVDLLFRIGGEEFLLYLPDTKEEDAVKLAEQLRQLIAESKLVEGRPVTVSFGVCGLQSGDIQDTWLKYADDALYEAKHSGRNRVVCSDRAKVAIS